VNNAGENDEIKQENRRLEKEKNDLLLQVWSLFFCSSDTTHYIK
jgi:hypothetical protein